MTDLENTYSRWNFVGIMYTSWYILYSIFTSGHRSPSLISHSLQHTHAVFRTVHAVVLLDIEDIEWYSRRISLLSRIQAEINVIHIPFRLQAVIFDISLTPTHGSVQNSPVVLIDIENIYWYSRWHFVAISHTAEICVIPYSLPVTGCHLWCITHLLVLPCFWTSKMVVSPGSSLIHLIRIVRS